MVNPLDNVTRFALTCSDGVTLRAEQLTLSAEPSALVVLCHPHPLHGGNMYSHVIGDLFTGLAERGAVTLRFNFRGTSGSEGRHGGGIDEQRDVEAAIDRILADHRSPGAGDRGESAISPSPPVVVIGYSFGAVVSLHVDHPAISAWMAIAPPLTMAEPHAMAAARRTEPKLIAAGTVDDFCPPDDVTRLTSGWINTTVEPLAGQNHFLATGTGRLVDLASELIDGLSTT